MSWGECALRNQKCNLWEKMANPKRKRKCFKGLRLQAIAYETVRHVTINVYTLKKFPFFLLSYSWKIRFAPLSQNNKFKRISDAII